MPSSDPHNRHDGLDARFRAYPAHAPADLVDRVMARLRESSHDSTEEILDEWVEASLAAWPRDPSAGFTEQTLAQIARDTAPISFGLWRLALPLAAGLAACITLVWAFPKTPPAAAAPAAAIATIDPDTAEILALAESLDQPARWLLDDAHFTTFVAAAE